ncbi:hypothetical protein Tco_0193936 [Tanacetum coccineum]
MSVPSGIASGLKQPIAQHQWRALVILRLLRGFKAIVIALSDLRLKRDSLGTTLKEFPLTLGLVQFSKIGSKWEELVVLRRRVMRTFFAKERLCNYVPSHTENILGNFFKLIVKGKVFWARAKELFVWSPSFKEVPEQELCSDDDSIKANEEANNLNLGDENDSEVVLDTYFGDNGEDQALITKQELTDSCQLYPLSPGFTPANDIPTCNQDSPDVASVRPTSKSARRNSSPCQSIGLSSRVMEDTVPADVYSSPVGSKPIHGSHKGGSLLEVLDGMIKVGQTMGFSMDGCLKDMEIIIGS